MPNVLHSAVFQPELARGETVLWTGKPVLSKNFTLIDIFLVPFSVFFFGFSVIWVSTVFGELQEESVPSAFTFLALAIGVPFAAYGLYMMLGRFWLKRWIKSHTYYAVTNKRALAMRLKPRRTLQSAYLNRVSTFSKHVRSDGSGDLLFGEREPLWQSNANTGLDFMASHFASTSPAFFDLEDVEEVYKIVQGQT